MAENPKTTRYTMYGLVAVLLILIAVYFFVPVLGTTAVE